MIREGGLQEATCPWCPVWGLPGPVLLPSHPRGPLPAGILHWGPREDVHGVPASPRPWKRFYLHPRLHHPPSLTRTQLLCDTACVVLWERWQLRRRLFIFNLDAGPAPPGSRRLPCFLCPAHMHLCCFALFGVLRSLSALLPRSFSCHKCMGYAAGSCTVVPSAGT